MMVVDGAIELVMGGVCAVSCSCVGEPVVVVSLVTGATGLSVCRGVGEEAVGRFGIVVVCVRCGAACTLS